MTFAEKSVFKKEAEKKIKMFQLDWLTKDNWLCRFRRIQKGDQLKGEERKEKKKGEKRKKHKLGVNRKTLRTENRVRKTTLNKILLVDRKICRIG